jgi:threonine dehydrogenase-like Zn-dependent dehydrogenase
MARPTRRAAHPAGSSSLVYHRLHGSPRVYWSRYGHGRLSGPRCIDAVGGEAHSHGSVDAILDKAKRTLKLGTDRAHVLREALFCCRKGGTVSIPGVYAGLLDELPFGAAMNEGLTLKMGQTHMQKYTKPLLAKIEAGDVDPSAVITHRLKLDDAPAAYKTFRDEKGGCVKVVLTP